MTSLWFVHVWGLGRGRDMVQWKSSHSCILPERRWWRGNSEKMGMGPRRMPSLGYLTLINMVMPVTWKQGHFRNAHWHLTQGYFAEQDMVQTVQMGIQPWFITNMGRSIPLPFLSPLLHTYSGNVGFREGQGPEETDKTEITRYPINTIIESSSLHCYTTIIVHNRCEALKNVINTFESHIKLFSI